MLVDLLLILIIKAFQQSLRLLPENGKRDVGVSLGRIAFRTLSTRREIAVSNIRKVFPEKNEAEARSLAKRCFEKLGINFTESLLLPYVPKSEYDGRFTMENGHYVEEALRRGKGMIALIFHFANWEIMGVATWFFQNPIIVLARPLKRHRLMNAFMNRMRASTGLTVIGNVNTSRDVMKYLKENSIIAILSDQREKRSKGVYVDFFGEPVPTNRGIATIAMKTGAPVVPVYLERRGFLRYVIRCNEPLEMERRGSIEESVAKNTRKINAFLESLIRANPEEWFWVHRRWGRRRR